MKRLATSLILLSLAAAGLAQQPFSYEGYLDTGGSPGEGEYDFVFSLFDAAIGGDQKVGRGTGYLPIPGRV